MLQQSQEKPRMSYAEFLKQLPQKQEGTVAWLIEKYIAEKSKPGRRPMGLSQLYTLRLVQRSLIGKVIAAQLKPSDFIDHCATRIAGVLGRPAVKPPTAKQDMTFLVVVLRHAEEIWEIPGVNLLAWRKAKRQLVSEQLIGKSSPRDRLPADEELDRLRAYFTARQKDPRTKIDMLLVMEAELTTGRRISELCRIERQHVNVEERTCWIYDLKNSKGKGFHAEFALIEGAWELFERRLREIPDDPKALLFPFNPHSCSAKYTNAKHALGIKGLRMHDNRAECFVRLLEKGYSKEQVQKGVSLHKGDGKVLVDTYLRIKARDLHRGPASKLGIENRPS
jgi:integrase